MSSRSRHGRPAPARGVLLGFATLVGLLALGGCPGHLGSDFPATLDDGGGGNTSSGGSPGTGGGNGTGGGGGTAPPCDAPTMVFQGSCAATSGCHTATDSLTLVGSDVEKNLIGTKSTQTITCVGMNLVNPAPPADGVLFKVLTGNTCGITMPIGPALMPEQIECIRSWVNSKL